MGWLTIFLKAYVAPIISRGGLLYIVHKVSKDRKSFEYRYFLKCSFPHPPENSENFTPCIQPIPEDFWYQYWYPYQYLVVSVLVYTFSISIGNFSI